LDGYTAGGGLFAVEKALENPDAILAEIEASGLRGRGGGGFPTAAKWRAVRAVEEKNKFVVCNGDEGDPGAFMDRMIMESYPFSVVEGMLLAGLVVGAERGIVYVRAEYPLAAQRMRLAVRACRDAGWLGDDIRGFGLSFDVEVFEGAGAFVCGEETALVASLEGRRGTPSPRPPYPAEMGFQKSPTIINNVETFANVPAIIRRGAADFAALGTDSSKGTKVFALAGKIRRGGLIEVPMGATLREIVFDIGGGGWSGRPIKAAQIGGPSGGCIPEREFDVPIDYDALLSKGAMMGSGGIVVLDEDDCMVDIAKYFMSFTRSESCGKCVFCRVGTKRMLEILDALTEGTAADGAVGKLIEIGEWMSQGSLCGLGRTAAKPALSAIRHFRSEFDAHVAGRCPAGKCKPLITYVVSDKCVGCSLCSRGCPVGAIEPKPYERHEIDPEKCVRCGACAENCPVGAISAV
jgi:NADH:ubiquinone oxidoreductase subunit F (NADH-binding)